MPTQRLWRWVGIEAALVKKSCWEWYSDLVMCAASHASVNRHNSGGTDKNMTGHWPTASPYYTALQGKKAVTAYFSGYQLLSFGCARQNTGLAIAQYTKRKFARVITRTWVLAPS